MLGCRYQAHLTAQRNTVSTTVSDRTGGLRDPGLPSAANRYRRDEGVMITLLLLAVLWSISLFDALQHRLEARSMVDGSGHWCR